MRLRMRWERSPWKNYEKIKEEILCERMVIHTFFRSMYPLLASAFSHCENTSIREKNPHMQDLQAMFKPGEVKDQPTGKVEKGHFCQACMCVLEFSYHYQTSNRFVYQCQWLPPRSCIFKRCQQYLADAYFTVSVLSFFMSL